MNKNNVIVGIGEILWDVFPDGKQLGGAPANFVYHCNGLGAESYVISCVGHDDLGCQIRCALEMLGISQKYIKNNYACQTGTVTVKVNQSGKPDYVIHEGVAWDHIPFTDEMNELAKKTDAICFGTLAQRNYESRNTIYSFLESVKPSCLKICDINLRQNYYNAHVIKNSLKHANILKLNDEELPIVAKVLGIKGGEDDMLYGLLKKFKLQLIVLTKGAKGSRLISDSKDLIHKGIQIDNVVDTVGAGDSFTAAMAVGLLSNEPLKYLLGQASRLASYVCSQPGATPKIPREIL